MDKETNELILYVSGLIGGGYASKAALSKLADVISQGAGLLYKRIERKDESMAKAKDHILIAEAEVIAQEIREKNLVVSPQLQGYLSNRSRQAQTIDDVAFKTTKYLDANVSDEPVNKDWSVRFFDTVKDVCSDELKEVWAKVLAGEISKPGSVGLRTLEILKNISQSEALLFLKFAAIATKQGIIFKYNGNKFDEIGLAYKDILLMRESGLISNGDNLRIFYEKEAKQINGNLYGVYQRYGKKVLFIGNQSNEKLGLENIALTTAGVELRDISIFDFNYEYLELTKEHLNRKGYFVEILNGSEFEFFEK